MKDLHERLTNCTKEDLIGLIEGLCEEEPDLAAKVFALLPDTEEADPEALKIQKQMTYYWDVARELVCEQEALDMSILEEVYTALDMIDELAGNGSLNWTWRRTFLDQMLGQVPQASSRFRYALIDTCGALCRTEEEVQYLEQEIRALPL